MAATLQPQADLLQNLAVVAVLFASHRWRMPKGNFEIVFRRAAPVVNTNFKVTFWNLASWEAYFSCSCARIYFMHAPFPAVPWLLDGRIHGRHLVQLAAHNCIWNGIPRWLWCTQSQYCSKNSFLVKLVSFWSACFPRGQCGLLSRAPTDVSQLITMLSTDASRWFVHLLWTMLRQMCLITMLRQCCRQMRSIPEASGPARTSL